MLQEHIYYKKVSGANYSRYSSIQDEFERKEKREIHNKVMEILRPEKHQAPESGGAEEQQQSFEVPSLKDEAFEEILKSTAPLDAGIKQLSLAKLRPMESYLNLLSIDEFFERESEPKKKLIKARGSAKNSGASSPREQQPHHKKARSFGVQLTHDKKKKKPTNFAEKLHEEIEDFHYKAVKGLELRMKEKSESIKPQILVSETPTSSRTYQRGREFRPNSRVKFNHELVTIVDQGEEDERSEDEEKLRLKKRRERMEHEFKIRELIEEGGVARIVRTSMAPTEANKQLEPTNQVRELLREYYYTKHMLRRDLLESLETQKNQRREVLELKRKNLKAENYAHKIGEELEKTRVKAELERLEQARGILKEEGVLYYRILKRLHS